MTGTFKQKAWGTICYGDCSPAYSVENIRIDPSKCCSIHLHRARHNQFIAMTGSLIVLSWPDYVGMELRRETFDPVEAYEHAKIDNIRGGDGLRCSLFVPAGVPHQFISLSPVQAVEIYTPNRGGALNPQDIERFTEGGEVHYKAMERIANYL